MDNVDISTLSDDELMDRLDVLVFRERCSAADVIEHLAEVDERALTVKRSYGSLFDYCLNRLKMSEGSAFRHIRAARSFRAFPPVLNLLRAGKLSLEGLALLHPHIGDADVAALVTRAAGLRTRQLERLLADRQKRVSGRDVIRLVAFDSAPEPPASAEPEFLRPDAAREIVVVGSPHQARPEIRIPPLRQALPSTRGVRISFTADEEFYRLLSVARSLLRHKYPDGRLEGVLGEALKALIARRDPVLRWRASPRRRKTSPA